MDKHFRIIREDLRELEGFYIIRRGCKGHYYYEITYKGKSVEVCELLRDAMNEVYCRLDVAERNNKEKN